LLAGLTTVLYEGKPIGTPDASVFWRVCAEYNVKAMFAAPTAMRAIRREDPEGELAHVQDLSKLRALFLAGERSDPITISWCQKLLGSNKEVIDCWWLTETGQPVTSTCLGKNATLFPIKPGSAGKPVPGANVCVLLDDGTPTTKPYTFGNLVIKLPMVPAAFTNLWNNEQGYIDSYFKRFPGYFDTGDAGMIDEEGYVHVMSRTDDLINVAGHRLSTGKQTRS
jgi:propionyl-CoA synthetase